MSLEAAPVTEVVEVPRKARKTPQRPLRVVVSEADRQRIELSAQMTGLSVSAYLRNLGVGMTLKSKVDEMAYLELLRLRADLGRLGGLLKMRLKDVDDPATSQLLAQIDEAKAIILKKVDSL